MNRYLVVFAFIHKNYTKTLACLSNSYFTNLNATAFKVNLKWLTLMLDAPQLAISFPHC